MQLFQDKKGGLMTKEYDYAAEGYYKPSEAIKATKPIIVIDEPHRFSKDNKTFEFINTQICPQCIIRFGATFPEIEQKVENKKVRVKDYHNLIYNLGIGGAVQTGYMYALRNNYDIAVQFDGDGQHDVNYVDKLIEPIIKNNCDFSIGSRFITDEGQFKSSKARRIGIFLISKLIKICTRVKITDPTSGFRAANKEIIKLFACSYPTEYPEPSSTVDLIRLGKKITEVPVSMMKRVAGKSSIHSWKQLYYMFNVLISIILSSIKKGEKR
jgi:glycosyltransferase involved in cell wall biosynthesis